MPIPFAERSNQEGINTGCSLIESYNSHICNVDNGHLALWLRVVRRWVLRWGIIFSKGLGDNSLFFSLCGWRSGVFLRLFLFFLRGMLGCMLGYFFAGLKRQTRMRTSWNVPSVYRSDQDVRAVTIWTYWGQNEDVLWSSWKVCEWGGRVIDENGRNGNEIELVTKRTWTGWSRTRTVWKPCK